MEGLATREQIAEYLNVKPQTLDAWVARRKGPPYVKVEGARRYDWTDVREWVETRKVRH